LLQGQEISKPLVKSNSKKGKSMTDLAAITAFAGSAKPALRNELEKVVTKAGNSGTPELMAMITYQLGWSGENAGPKAEGKQLRALFCLLSCQAAGGDWKQALPAAAAIELIHNFSLIHDDIEDNGQFRRGRPTIWKVWGEAQAINTGDAIFALANASLLNLADTISVEATLKASTLFQSTCLQLTQGQHLDIAFEDLDQVSIEDYFHMVSGKTAALLAFSFQVGALCAGANPAIQDHYYDFGRSLGLAFQVLDDILGIWGEEERTGKTTSGDLVTRKKTLPVIYGLNQKQDFYQGWISGEMTPNKIHQLSDLLESEGGLSYAQSEAGKLTEQALISLENAQPQGEAGQILKETAHQLLSRQV
jgi:geranylgeranyl diphosphate synthase type I